MHILTETKGGILAKGDVIYDESAFEEHVILEVHQNGTLTIQYAAMNRAGLSGGTNTIPASMVDGVRLKKIR